MRAFYRIKRSAWPLTINGEESRADSVALGGTVALLIVHSSIHPNRALEALTDAKFLGNTYAELLQSGIATTTQKSHVFQSSYIGSTGDVRNARTSDVPSTATVIQANLIPHSWGGQESVREQADVDALST